MMGKNRSQMPLTNKSQYLVFRLSFFRNCSVDPFPKFNGRELVKALSPNAGCDTFGDKAPSI